MLTDIFCIRGGEVTFQFLTHLLQLGIVGDIQRGQDGTQVLGTTDKAVIDTPLWVAGLGVDALDHIVNPLPRSLHGLAYLVGNIHLKLLAQRVHLVVSHIYTPVLGGGHGVEPNVHVELGADGIHRRVVGLVEQCTEQVLGIINRCLIATQETIHCLVPLTLTVCHALSESQVALGLDDLHTLHPRKRKLVVFVADGARHLVNPVEFGVEREQ